MSRRVQGVVISALCVALALALLYGAYEATRALRLSRAVEEGCQSALAEAIDHMAALQVNLEKLMVTGDGGQQKMLLARISHQAGEAQSCLTALPLSHEAMAAAVRFCAQAGDYACTLAGQGALTPGDGDQLEALGAQAGLLWSRLEMSRQQMLGDALSFYENGPAFYQPPQREQRPVEGLYEEKGLYPALVYDGPFSDNRPRGKALGLPEEMVTREEALEIARRFVGEAALSASPAPDTQGPIPAWGVTVETADVMLNLEITRQGGKVLWMMPEHGNFEPLVPLGDCCRAAEAFLESRGFGRMEMTGHQAYEGIVTLSFCALQEGVLLYPDQVKVQCRLDTAQVVGLEAAGYWMNHRLREDLTPGLTLDQAREALSGRLEVTGHRLCLIPLLNEEWMCYEFTGTWGENAYRVYIDAHTGAQREVLKVVPTRDGILAL